MSEKRWTEEAEYVAALAVHKCLMLGCVVPAAEDRQLARAMLAALADAGLVVGPSSVRQVANMAGEYRERGVKNCLSCLAPIDGPPATEPAYMRCPVPEIHTGSRSSEGSQG